MATADSHPQPKTMAPSKNDVVQNLMYYFGAPVSPEKLKDYSEHHAQTYHFPDAFVGSNVKIRDTLNNLIVKVCPCPSTCMCTTRVSPVPPLRFCLAVATELADVGRSALFPDRGRRRRVGRTLRLSQCLRRPGAHPLFFLAQQEIRYDVRLMQRVPVRCRRLVPPCVSTVLILPLLSSAVRRRQPSPDFAAPVRIA